MNEILTKIGLSLACAIDVIVIVVAISCICGEITGATNCAYCHGTITESADYVCMKDGRRMHTGCYMRAIREDVNSDMNTLTNVENEEDDSIIREFIVHPDGVISGSWNEGKKVILDASE